MRWSYIVPRFVLLVLVWAFFFFAFDPLLKLGIRKGLEKGLKARVEITGLTTSFFHPSLKLTGFSAADSDDEFRNIVEFSELSFAAAGTQLLEKKLLVENAALSGLRFGTARKTSGKLPAAAQEPPSELMTSLKAESKNFTLERVADAKAGVKEDYAINPVDLESVKLARQLEEDYNKNYKDISGRLDMKKYEAALDSLKSRYEKAKGEKNFAKQAKEYSRIGKEIKQLNADFKKDKEEVRTALAKAKNAFKAIDEARKKDTAAAMSKMKLPSLDTQSIARMLAGPLLAEKTEQAMKWMTMAKRYMPTSAKGALKNEAPRGREVHFPRENTYPTVLVRKLDISGELGLEDPLAYTGTVEGLTNQPQVYGRPTTASLKGAKGARRMDFRLSLDATGDAIRTDSSLSYSGMPVKELALGSESSFMVNITGASGAIDAALKTSGGDLDGKAAVRLTGGTFKASADKIKAAPLRSAVQSSFAGLSSALIETDIKGTMKAPRLAIKTDLADKLSKAFTGALGAEVKKAREAAQKKIDEALKPYTDKLNKLSSSTQAELDNKLNGAESKLTGAGDKLLKGLTPSKVKLPKFKF